MFAHIRQRLQNNHLYDWQFTVKRVGNRLKKKSVYRPTRRIVVLSMAHEKSIWKRAGALGCASITVMFKMQKNIVVVVSNGFFVKRNERRATVNPPGGGMPIVKTYTRRQQNIINRISRRGLQSPVMFWFTPNLTRRRACRCGHYVVIGYRGYHSLPTATSTPACIARGDLVVVTNGYIAWSWVAPTESRGHPSHCYRPCVLLLLYYYYNRYTVALTLTDGKKN